MFLNFQDIFWTSLPIPGFWMTNSIKLFVIKIQRIFYRLWKHTDTLSEWKGLKFEIGCCYWFFLLISVLNKHINKYYDNSIRVGKKIFRDVHHMPRWMRESRANQLTGKKKGQSKKRKEQKIANAANPSRAILWSLL